MRFPLSLAVLLALSAPAMAQDVDFGDDASQWANDNQCDDMRFEGSGMTTTLLLESDVGHDASDCAAAFAAGNLTLVDGGGADISSTPAADVVTNATPATSSLGGGKGDRVQGGGNETPPTMPVLTVIDGITFGDDSGEWTADGECDDRRFYGAGMAESLTWEHLGRDATDCSTAYQAGTITPWIFTDALAATSCEAVDFGDDDGEYPNDYECDDYRFEGRGAAMRLVPETIGHDASDCQRLCDFGMVGLRDY